MQDDNSKIKNEFKQMKDVEFPAELHGRIMRSVYLRQFKVPLVAINGLLFINFTISTWHLWRALKEQMVGLAGNSATLSQSYAYLIKALQFVPTSTSAIFMINLAMLSVGVYILMRLNQTLMRGKITRN